MKRSQPPIHQFLSKRPRDAASADAEQHMPSTPARRLVVVASGSNEQTTPVCGTIVGNAYAVPRSALNAAQLAHHTGQLTMVPLDTFTKGDAGSFDMYTLTPTHLFVPRFYGLEKFGPAEHDRTWAGEAIDAPRCEFVGALKDEQRVVVERVRERFGTGDAPRGGLLVLPCGFGKTVLAIHVIACVARVKTIILVHTSGLLEQWCERLRAFAPRLTVGVHKQSQLDVECDVLVAMIQTVARRPYAGGELRNRGLVIVDEAHHLGARVYGSAMAKLACRYTLGLSATPDRRDGLTRIQFMTLGTIIHKAERAHQNVHVTELLLPAVGGTATNASGRPNFAGMINELARSRERSDLLAAHLRRLHGAGRAILVLSERKQQLQYLHEALRRGGIDAAELGFYVGDSNAEERARCVASCAVTFSTFQMAREGLDIPRLDCLVVASPCSDLVQAVGRIQRKAPCAGTPPPLVLDAVDAHPIFRSMARKRHKYYRAAGFVTQCVSAEGEVRDGGGALFI